VIQHTVSLVNVTAVRRPFVWSVLLIAVLSMAGIVRAASDAEFAVKSVVPTWNDNVYQVTAELATPLGQPASEALLKGVALTITLDIEVTRQRRFWLDSGAAHIEQRYQLRYHALTDRYVLTNLNTGIQTSMASLQSAQEMLNTVPNLPVLDRQLLDPSEQYSGRMRVRLDVDALPAPLKLLAYFSPAWHQSSDWYIWKLTM